MLRNELRITVRSGELIVGLLSRSTHGPERWWLALTGVERPDSEDFVWRGDAATDRDAFDALAASESVSRYRRYPGSTPRGDEHASEPGKGSSQRRKDQGRRILNE
jgi:hypothetical protein